MSEESLPNPAEGGVETPEETVEETETTPQVPVVEPVTVTPTPEDAAKKEEVLKSLNEKTPEKATMAAAEKKTFFTPEVRRLAGRSALGAGIVVGVGTGASAAIVGAGEAAGAAGIPGGYALAGYGKAVLIGAGKIFGGIFAFFGFPFLVGRLLEEVEKLSTGHAPKASSSKPSGGGGAGHH